MKNVERDDGNYKEKIKRLIGIVKFRFFDDLTSLPWAVPTDLPHPLVGSGESCLRPAQGEFFGHCDGCVFVEFVSGQQGGADGEHQAHDDAGGKPVNWVRERFFQDDPASSHGGGEFRRMQRRRKNAESP
ncbi:MAG: hypothetical protein WED15_05215 [Akkermansiaceae bacterium]